MEQIIVNTQLEYDSIPPFFNGLIIVKGKIKIYGSASVVAHESARVVAYESASVVAHESASVVAYESARVEARGSARVEAYESARVEARGSARVEARGSARVEAYGSASVEARGSASVVAYESASVVAHESARVVAGQYVAVHKMSNHIGDIQAINIIIVPPITTPTEWCLYYGIVINEDIALVYKAVRDNYISAHGTSYAPGQIPIAGDWDGGVAECGGGLHFSPRPVMAKEFDNIATKYIACPVAIKDMRNPRLDDQYPNKIKAARCAGPVYEVDEWGEKIVTDS
jgi:hypothetical protein